jgi:hypothetical protein
MYTKILVGNFDLRKLLRIRKGRWEDNIKIDSELFP